MKNKNIKYKIGDKLKIIDKPSEIREIVSGFGERELIVTISDIIYKTSSNKWFYEVSWRNDAFDCGDLTFSLDFFHTIVIQELKEKDKND